MDIDSDKRSFYAKTVTFAQNECLLLTKKSALNEQKKWWIMWITLWNSQKVDKTACLIVDNF